MAFAHPGAYTGNNQDYLGAAINPLQPFGGLNPAPGSMPSTNADAYNQRTTADLQPRDYSGVQRPRHEMQGAPYQDMTRPTPSGEILNAAAQTAEVNKQLEQQRKHRKDYLNDVWQRPHEPPVQPNRPGTAEESTPRRLLKPCSLHACPRQLSACQEISTECQHRRHRGLDSPWVLKRTARSLCPKTTWYLHPWLSNTHLSVRTRCTAVHQALECPRA